MIRLGIPFKKKGEDWIYGLCRLSYNPRDIDFDQEGDWEVESNQADKLLLMEGARFPYGYIPLYRDRGTYCLVMQRNRSLTIEQEEEARKYSLSTEDIQKKRESVLKMKARVRESEGDYG
jgi:hypothetical protein